jgi:Protein of unknown function (DUF2938)
VQALTIEIVVVGVIATLATDLWQLLLQAITGLPPMSWGLVGRWVAWILRGVFVHQAITAAPKIRGEIAIGWVFHYAVGILYAALYIAIIRLAFGSEPTLISALAFALVLLVAPWFVMQPALGLGFFATRTPKPAATRVRNVAVHTVFGLGLYLGAIAWPFAVVSSPS